MQFWIGQRESFYCDLQECSETLDRTATSNNTRHTCARASCSCIPGRMLCGERGSIDIGDFLSEEIKGPATMTCKTNGSKRDCRFEEPAMNDLISSVFGDSSISLTCSSGECVHFSQVPGYAAPLPPETPIFWVAFSAASALLAVAMVATLLWVLGRHAKHEEDGAGGVQLPQDEAARSLLADHVPASLAFQGLSYRIQGKTVLSGITGTVKPGELMAIVGSSGAGKTTCEWRSGGGVMTSASARRADQGCLCLHSNHACAPSPTNLLVHPPDSLTHSHIDTPTDPRTQSLAHSLTRFFNILTHFAHSPTH